MSSSSRLLNKSSAVQWVTVNWSSRARGRITGRQLQLAVSTLREGNISDLVGSKRRSLPTKSHISATRTLGNRDRTARQSLVSVLDQFSESLHTFGGAGIACM